MNKEVKNIYLGMDILTCPYRVDKRDIVSLCLLIDDKIFYLERNDVDYSNYPPLLVSKVIDNLVLFNNEENQIYYKNGNDNITYIKDNKEQLSRQIKKIMSEYCKNSDINVIGMIEAPYFALFESLLFEVDLKEDELFNSNLNMVSMDSVLKILEKSPLLKSLSNLKGYLDNEKSIIAKTFLVRKMVDVL